MYKFKYCVDKLAKGKDKINAYYFSSELELLENYFSINRERWGIYYG